MSDHTITFTVLGIPAPKGSTKAFFRPGMKFPIVTNDNKNTKPWANGVRLVAQEKAPTGGPWEGPVSLALEFRLPKPKSTAKKVIYHIKKPDLDKLVRTVKDALKGVLYTDDSQVVQLSACKDFATEEHAPGVFVIGRKVQP